MNRHASSFGGFSSPHGMAGTSAHLSLPADSQFIHRLSAYTHTSIGDSTVFLFPWKRAQDRGLYRPCVRVRIAPSTGAFTATGIFVSRIFIRPCLQLFYWCLLSRILLPEPWQPSTKGQSLRSSETCKCPVSARPERQSPLLGKVSGATGGLPRRRPLGPACAASLMKRKTEDI